MNHLISKRERESPGGGDIDIGHGRHGDTGDGTWGHMEWDMGTQRVGHGEWDMGIWQILKTHCWAKLKSVSWYSIRECSLIMELGTNHLLTSMEIQIYFLIPFGVSRICFNLGGGGGRKNCTSPWATWFAYPIINGGKSSYLACKMLSKKYIYTDLLW